jgi:hypothetical protein
MCQDMADKHDPTIEMNGSNEAIFVATDVENKEFINCVRLRKNHLQFLMIAEGIEFHQTIPTI